MGFHTAQIFDKALVETTFTAMYAQFCSELNKNLPEFEDPDSEDGKMLTFRRILLNKCQVRGRGRAVHQWVIDGGVSREADAYAAIFDVHCFYTLLTTLSMTWGQGWCGGSISFPK